jgi:hypothetical protein
VTQATRASGAAEAKAAFDDLLAYCQACEAACVLVEKGLLRRMAVLACCLIRLSLTARHERCDVRPHLEDGAYRLRAAQTVKHFLIVFVRLTARHIS